MLGFTHLIFERRERPVFTIVPRSPSGGDAEPRTQDPAGLPVWPTSWSFGAKSASIDEKFN